MAKDNQRIALTKRLLKEALIQLLGKKDIQKVSISELCEKAGINRATFYRHYETPRNLLEDIGKDLFYEMLDNLVPPKTLEDFERYIEEMCTYLYENADLIRILIRCSSDQEVFRYIREIYALLLKEYEKAGVVLDMDPDSIRFMTTYFGGGGYFLLREWLTEDIQKTPKEIAALVYQLTCSGDLLMKKAKEMIGKQVTIQR